MHTLALWRMPEIARKFLPGIPGSANKTTEIDVYKMLRRMDGS